MFISFQDILDGWNFNISRKNRNQKRAEQYFYFSDFRDIFLTVGWLYLKFTEKKYVLLLYFSYYKKYFFNVLSKTRK